MQAKTVIAVVSLLIVSALAGYLLALPVAPVKADAPVKMDICHGTASHSNPYSSLNVDLDAIDGDAGNDHGQGDHYLTHTGPIWFAGITTAWGDIIPPIPGVHNGLNWSDEGRAILNNSCNIPGVSPSPTPDPNCEGENECTQPTPTPTPTPTNGSGHESAIDKSCEGNSFRVTFKVKDNGQPVAGVEVTFVYAGETREATTDASGEVYVIYDWKGAGQILATAGGYDSQTLYVSQPCSEASGDPNRSTPQVLGASTEASKGKVLGASTMASAGVAENMVMDLVGGAGAMLTLVGSTLKSRKQS